MKLIANKACGIGYFMAKVERGKGRQGLGFTAA